MKITGKLWWAVAGTLLLIGAAVGAFAWANMGWGTRLGAALPAGLGGSWAPRLAGPGAWGSSAPMPIFRSEMNAVPLNGKIYVGGGLAGPDPNFTGTTDAFHVYDPATNSWQVLQPLPNRLHHLGIAAQGDQVYVTGGYDGEDFNIDVSTTYVYTTATNTWGRLADMPAPRAAHASVALGGLIYVVGGVGSNSNQLWVYNPATNTWDASRPPLPTIREHLTAAAVNGKLYVIAGRWSNSNMSTVEEYDPATNAWTSKAPIPTARSGLTSGVVNGRIHVTGGEDLFSSNTYFEHEAYDPATNTWVTLPRMPTARHGLASGAVNGDWYVIGGGLLAGNQTYFSLTDIVEVYLPNATPTPTPPVTSTPVPPSPTRTPPPPTNTPPTTPNPTITPCPVNFTDVDTNNPFYVFIRCLACRYIVSGYADGTFRPNTNITRGQVAKIVAGAAGLATNVPSTQQTFSDVPNTNTFWIWIERLWMTGAVSGYTCGRPGEPCDPQNRPYFRWSANITRGQLSKITAVTAGWNGPVPTTQQTFTDVPPNNPFWTWIEELASHQIISGYTCGGLGEPCDPQNRPYFRWGHTATRGQTSKIAANVFFPGCQTP